MRLFVGAGVTRQPGKVVLSKEKIREVLEQGAGGGGLGLPERDYYTRDDERSVQLREAYVTHVAKQFVNLGDEADGARDAAGPDAGRERRRGPG